MARAPRSIRTGFTAHAAAGRAKHVVLLASGVLALCASLAGTAGASLSVNPVDWFNDAFPFNETPGAPGVNAAFDTAAAFVKTGRNIAPLTGNPNRYCVPGDSSVVTSSTAATGVYLNFRILPGPGNYFVTGRPDLSPAAASNTSGLRAVRPGFGIAPKNKIAAVPGDVTDFFESYMSNNGVHGTPGGHSGGKWDPNIWNSAQCDTANAIVFPQAGAPTNSPWTPNPLLYQSTYHDSEPRGHFGALGVPRNLCFYPSPTSPPGNIVCDTGIPPAHVAPFGAATPNPASGWPGALASPPGLWTFSGSQVRTSEGTKILPDGIFTPGTSIQYFSARYSIGAPSGSAPVEMIPDTNVVFPQVAEGSEDAHRWQQFGVLPDAWKFPIYKHPLTGAFGDGLGCMLVVDNGDGSGDERVLVSVADSIGATEYAKRGAHNGWSAPGGGHDINDPAHFVARHYGQPGTTWDLYQVRGSTSSPTDQAGSLGSRLSIRDLANTQIFGSGVNAPGKTSRIGPTPDMLAAYYQGIFFMSGHEEQDILGPFNDHSQDETAIIQNFVLSSMLGTTRWFYGVGDGLVQSIPPATSQDALMQSVFATALSASAGTWTGEMTTYAGVFTPASKNYGTPGGGPAFGPTLGVWTNDVLDLGIFVPSAVAASDYTSSPPGTYHSGIRVLPGFPTFYGSLIDGFNIQYVTGLASAASVGRLQYYFDMLTSFDCITPEIVTITCSAGCVEDAPDLFVVPGMSVVWRVSPTCDTPNGCSGTGCTITAGTGPGPWPTVPGSPVTPGTSSAAVGPFTVEGVYTYTLSCSPEITRTITVGFGGGGPVPASSPIGIVMLSLLLMAGAAVFVLRRRGARIGSHVR